MTTNTLRAPDPEFLGFISLAMQVESVALQWVWTIPSIKEIVSSGDVLPETVGR
jgi:hypothetical protein